MNLAKSSGFIVWSGCYKVVWASIVVVGLIFACSVCAGVDDGVFIWLGWGVSGLSLAAGCGFLWGEWCLLEKKGKNTLQKL